MVKVRSRGEKVRRYILENVDRHPADIAKRIANEFGITRQAASKHLSNLVDEKALVESGNTRNRIYRLCPVAQIEKTYPLTSDLQEDVVWRNDIVEMLAGLAENGVDIWRYCFTEMFNNAIDHSDATRITVDVTRTAATTQMCILDNGVGIFKKIKDALGLLDERHAVFELSKGKLTTDPANHTGEGIFFSSRMVDRFGILSSATYFSHKYAQQEDWILADERTPTKGTCVKMELSNHTARTTKEVFDQFTSDEHMGFTKTVVPVRLAQYGDDKLVSRSQAKRLLERVDRFKTVLFDFTGVTTIGQSFADEIFRVFAVSHPTIDLTPIHANEEVTRAIVRARSAIQAQPLPPASDNS
jgi:hypothetical protein